MTQAKKIDTTSNTEKERTTFYLKTSLKKSLKYMAFTEEKSQTDIIDTALSGYIKDFEKKHGPIPKNK